MLKHKFKIAIISSTLILTPAIAFDLGKVLSDAVDKSVNNAVNKATGNARAELNRLFSTVIPKVGSNAKTDDGKGVNLSKGVYIFGYQGCSPSRQAFAFMKKNGIAYQMMDVHKDAKASRVANQQGIRGVPTMYVNGEKIVGFNSTRYQNLLKKHGKMK